MGREKTILLGLLGLLAGVFVGVLSLKLLVPRPPTGAGPDIRPEVAVTTAQERVAPPAPSPGGWDFAAAPPLVADIPPTNPPPVAAAPLPPASRFPRAEPAAPSPVAAARTDEAVAPVAWQRPADFAPVSEPVMPAAIPVLGAYVVQAGDSWWDVADRAYGDGRLYRALFAWNRARDARITLAPGTRLDVPPLDRLRATWPQLVSPTPPR